MNLLIYEDKENQYTEVNLLNKKGKICKNCIFINKTEDEVVNALVDTDSNIYKEVIDMINSVVI